MKDPEGENPSQEEIADQTVSEYESYWSSIRTQLLIGSGFAAFIYLILRFVEWGSNLPGTVGTDDVQVLLVPIPAGIALAGFGILSTIVIALQVMVKTVSNRLQPIARELARKQFLVDFARLLIPFVMLFGIYLAFQNLDTFASVDFVRLFGPILTAILIAIFAADAGTYSNPELADNELQLAWRRRRSTLLEAGCRAAKAGTSESKPRERLNQIVVLVCIPPLMTALLQMFLLGGDLGITLAVLLVSSAIAICVYALVVNLFHLSVVKAWMDFTVLIIAAVGISSLFLASIVSIVLILSGQYEPWGYASKTLLVYFMLLLSTVFLALRSISSGTGNSSRGFLRELLVRRIEKNLNRLKNLSNSSNLKSKPPLNRLAISSVFLSVFPPLGLILGGLARVQIAEANERGQVKQRGMKMALWTIRINWIAFALLILALIIVSYTDFK
ncbi:hypothetical protein CQ019_01515 [Arthrobacter sp. MYb229]|uniref:DUF4190 domain-containing protein n=1 Tax=unclassified Arthrobacter TaxID=235627 RepID=UPI000CFBC0F9|nr:MULTISPECIES: DUF4190 domain-containing protein [unclassified Arthrobacter]PRA06118.1 hypothetical protein CQ019_01515 [Arthrobacter sp. MYb229]PRB53020.1 hypothetical protein CQ013_01515 [Arthrobacter sp. MYb216]